MKTRLIPRAASAHAQPLLIKLLVEAVAKTSVGKINKKELRRRHS